MHILIPKALNLPSSSSSSSTTIHSLQNGAVLSMTEPFLKNDSGDMYIYMYQNTPKAIKEVRKIPYFI